MYARIGFTFLFQWFCLGARPAHEPYCRSESFGYIAYPDACGNPVMQPFPRVTAAIKQNTIFVNICVDCRQLLSQVWYQVASFRTYFWSLRDPRGTLADPFEHP